MKRIISVVLVLIMTMSLVACGGKTSSSTKTEKDYTPTYESVVEGIKNEFKDPDSVQLSDASYADVKDAENEWLIIGTVRAKNSFGGYGDPQAYVISCKGSTYKIVEEFNDASYMDNKYFVDHGCNAAMSLKHAE
ncbi:MULTISPECIES: hypothetical protein [unclassified Candidatus Paralachnospira]|uniref:hypothetical protein n=1 Tax=unclassified Candidatus Paralachnospira TaxID=3099471 RepID=UPI003F91229B